MRTRRRIGSVACVALLVAGCGASGGVVVVDAWTRPTPPGVDSAAFYVTIENRGAAPSRYLGATSPVCAVVVPHLSTFDDDLASMGDAPSAVLELAAGGRIEMEPNGLHLMCLGLTAPLAEGDEIAVDVELDGADPVVATVIVEQR